LASSADIVLSGGGLVGVACAVSLAQLDATKGMRIVLLEESPKRNITLGAEQYSNRVVALNPGSIQLLKRLGAWKIIDEHRHNDVRKMKIWDACSDSAITFSNDDGSPLSSIVENDLVQAALNQVLEGCTQNVTIIYGAKVEQYSLPNMKQDVLPAEAAYVTLDSGETIETSLLIGSDGNRSLVRESLGVPSLNWEYGSMGLVANLQLMEEMENHTAFQRFLPSGPLALLPLNTKYSSLVWTLPMAKAKEKMAMTEEEFVADLERNLWDNSSRDELATTAARGLDTLIKSFFGHKPNSQLPPRIKGAKNRAGFPLGFIHSTRYVGPRTVLVGDAAHRVHPLAGQGVNLGFGDVVTLTRVLNECIRDGAGLGNMAYLHEYETERQRHNLPTMFSIDALEKLYSSTFTPVVIARTLGLQVTDSIGPLKKVLMSHASS